ncbi:hypothetical protein HXX76_001756 [Chlamydomonas incerta]|uniref:Guanylate cyclase domain-containing protein n=1 Tax=Chlamydomonas incerta TaxID=51695 RepID=A0A835WA04_CHLIN|nr:hypothetical protein HXX76_001756 [Chlamydomonas incerta]|eukprot:KAG2443396.1 hypothetical protein HXX76_001756 [Chlamydomonas incerta]
MFYRAEALAALAAGSHTPSAAPPDDWEQLIALLEAHRLAHSSSGSSSSSSTSLPKYGLCITTHADCGRLGDVWAAVAASVMQTEDTEQGYLYDLEGGSPTSAPPLANSTGWVYATELLQRMLVYNAPEPAATVAAAAARTAAAAAASNHSVNTRDHRDVVCTDVSTHFKAGDCMVTVDWDIMLEVLNTTQLLSPEVRLRVAPLPGSRTVMDRRLGSRTAGRLVPCDWERCGVSANHDLLYLGLQAEPPRAAASAVSAAAAAAAESELARTRAAVAAAAQSLGPVAPLDVLAASNGGSLPNHCEPSVTAGFESAAVQQVLAAAAAGGGVEKPAAGALVNRAPYSACMTTATRYQSEDATSGVTISSHTFATVGAILTSLTDSAYIRRNVATLMARAALGYPVTTSSSGSGASGASNSTSGGGATSIAVVGGSSSNTSYTSTGTAVTGSSAEVAAGAADSSSSTEAAGGMLLYQRMRWWTALREPFNVSGFADTGISNDTIQSYAQAVWHGLHAPNAAPEASSPSSVNFLKWGLGRAAAMLIAPNDTGTAAAVNASRALQSVMYMVNEAFTERATRAMYESSIEYQPLLRRSGTSPGGGTSSKSLNSAALAGLLVGLTMAVVLGIGVVVAVVALRMRRRNRDLLGRIRAPRAGPDTTLLISDIQNSTRLWEELSVATMDAALRAHHATFRKLMPAHDGYESATEGDSFIICFNSPASALAFATACQLALLQQDWPPELLQHPDGAVVAVEVRRRGGEGPSGGGGGGRLNSSRRSPAVIKDLRRELQSMGKAQGVSPFGAVASLWGRLCGCCVKQQAQGFGGGLSGPCGGGGGERRRERQLGGGAGGAEARSTRNGGLAAVLQLDYPGGPDAFGGGSVDDGRSSYYYCGGGGGVPNGDADSGADKELIAALMTTTPVNAQQQMGSLRHTQQQAQLQLAPVLVKAPAPGGVTGAAGVDWELRDCGSGIASQCELSDQAGGGQLQLQQEQAQAQATPVTPAGSDADRPSASCSCAMLTATSAGNAAVAAAAAWGGVTWARALELEYPLENAAAATATDRSDATSGGGRGGGSLSGAATPLRRLVKAAYASNSNGAAKDGPGSSKIICFRGPRVRMGLHCGLEDGQHVVWNRVNSTFQYTGPFAETAKIVSDAAHGGQVTLSAAAFARYRNSTSTRRTSGAAGHAPRTAVQGIVIAYAGHHVLSDKAPKPSLSKGGDVASAAASSATHVEHIVLDLELCGGGLGGACCVSAAQPAAAEAMPPAPTPPGDTVALFVAVPGPLLCRLAHTPPLRTVRQVQLGSLEAPTGSSVTIAFMKVVGSSTLLTELPRAAARAMDQFQRLACGLLLLAGAEVDQQAATGAIPNTVASAAAADFIGSGGGGGGRGGGGGYLVEAGDGLVLAAFGSPLAAVEWAINTREGLRELAWEEELLAHELCAEVLTVSPAAATSAAAANAVSAVARAAPPAASAASHHHHTAVRVPGSGPSPLGPAAAGGPRLVSTSQQHAAFGPASASASAQQLPLQQHSSPSRASHHQQQLTAGMAGGADLAPAPVVAAAGTNRVVAAAAAARHTTTERGLRVKVGLDVGPVTYSLTESSGRLSYRGRVMNRAARIAGTAGPGQVLCSGGVWAACEAAMAAAAALPGAGGGGGWGGRQQLVGVSLGKVALKGISSPVEIFQCQRE